MDRAELQAYIARAEDPNLIPGIYNYCDRCCHRCSFRQRCLTYLETRDVDDEDPEAVMKAVGDSFARATELMKMFAEKHGIPLDQSPEDAATITRQIEAQDHAADADPIVVASRRYPTLAVPIAQALLPVVRLTGSHTLQLNVERIGELAFSISVKTHRAVHGAWDEDYDPSEIQSDANGSAKIARLMIAESIRCWSDVMKAGQAAADGEPARIVSLLKELDRMLAERFPCAMSFVRPGFDPPVEIGS